MQTINWETVSKIISRPQKGTKRPFHFLKRSKHIPATPKRVIFFDSESHVCPDTHKHTPYIICASFVNYEIGKQVDMIFGSEIAQEKDKNIRPLSEFWREVVKFTKLRDLTWVMAHNIGYDLLATGGALDLFEIGFKPLGVPYEKGLTFIWDIAKPNPGPRYCGNVWTKKTKKGIEISSVCVEDEPCRKCQRKPKNINPIRFVSTSNYYPLPLSALGKTFALEKLAQEVKFDFGKIYDYPIDQVLKYCIRDVEIIQKAIEALFTACQNGERTGFGSFRNTLPAMSFNAFRTWHIPPGDGEILCHDNDEVISLERAAYYGGRVEVWKHGPAPETVYNLDINSMYPFVMREFQYPTRYISHRKTETIDGLRALLQQGYAVIAKVTIRTRSAVYPMRYKGRLIAPVGTFQTVISTPEIEHALEHNHIVQLHEIAVYEQSNIFAGFVDNFYNARQQAKAEGDNASDLLYKLILNSLYGKFGQLKREWHEVGTCPDGIIETEEMFDMDSGQNLRFRKFGGKIYMEDTQEDVAYNSAIAIAAHVTANARMLLWKYINVAGLENHYYNDTDSLFVNINGLRRLEQAGLIDPGKLGFLALEAEHERITFYGPKHYETPQRRTLKGISANATQINDRTFQQLQWPSFRSALRTGKIDGFANVEITKTLNPEYGKGWVTKKGNVRPLVFDGDRMIPWHETEYATIDKLAEEQNKLKVAGKF